MSVRHKSVLCIKISQQSGTCSLYVNMEDWKRFSSLPYYPTFHTFTTPSVKSLSAGHANSFMWCLKYATRNQASAGHDSPVTWCLKDTTKSIYYNEILIIMPGNRQYRSFASFCRSFIFEFLPLIGPPVLQIPLFPCRSRVQLLLVCLTFPGNFYPVPSLPTALQLVIRKAEL